MALKCVSYGSVFLLYTENLMANRCCLCPRISVSSLQKTADIKITHGLYAVFLSVGAKSSSIVFKTWLCNYSSPLKCATRPSQHTAGVCCQTTGSPHQMTTVTAQRLWYFTHKFAS